MDYQESLDFLYEQLPIFQRIGKAAMKKDLTNTIVLAEALSNPQHDFKSVHIAGTNGKGSTAHMFASVLQEAGYRVGLYTSPHLKSFRERIRVNGQLVSKEFVVDFVERCKNLMVEVKPSFFEMTVIMAFEYFSKEKVDIAVIETGLGGRLDSTNIILPELSVITSIGLDHEDILGTGLANIAREKAGIIKESIPVIIGDLASEAKEEVAAVAKQKKAPVFCPSEWYETLVLADHHIRVVNRDTKKSIEFTSELGGYSLLKNVPLILEGVSQLRTRGFAISDQQAVDGIRQVVSHTGLKGRWQKLRVSPTVVADIGHNEEAVRELMSRLDTQRQGAKLHVVWGMAGDKSIESIFRLLLKDASYYFCAADIPRALSVNELARLGDEHKLNYTTHDTVSAAYEAALANVHKEDWVFVGGSTFVVAEIKDI
ncbi:dihydrofolate synthase / folylpolyglutamate synthase [Reichenbachiella agariperforans]|uniref:Dihydrofolate synthase/folylpolyglutamate synthase n=1 Tax=Reichenbachiella agariperforans TaxID=156994 RepID=A0A1M6SIR9_REIAG|nr:folylpolyglutamate synthase/dihydrofolate synthase family protein [Reichenbachiella agariperforans]SHK44478.1 dihydrofolate synthase / folylpolyglutamate synthase [Reichenbachiella agariperforans]